MELASKTPWPSSPASTEVSNEEKSHLLEWGLDPDAEKAGAGKVFRDISRKQLINKLNLINFQNQTLSAVFKHTSYGSSLSLNIQPLPCLDKRLSCSWAEAVDVQQLTDSYTFDSLVLLKGQQLFEIKAEFKGANETHVFFLLPETCRQISSRRQCRYRCKEIGVFLLQNGAFLHGELIDYSAFQLRVRVGTSPPQTFRWIDEATPVSIVLTHGSETLYSAECRILRQDNGKQSRFINLEPLKNKIHRFGSREFRCMRHQLSPSPDAAFQHPLFGKPIMLKVLDISGSGFAVEEEKSAAVLLPGLIIPKLDLLFGDGTSLSCLAQVVYSHPHREDHQGESMLRCGLAILDMPIEDHIRLLAYLHQVSDARSYICSKVDMDELWNFFFETGFIYPQKYEFIQSNKEIIKNTYARLYNMSPRIASHFTYQENGRLLAHMAMVRFFESSWLIHHHAAIRSSFNRGGIMVLNQVGRFINESHRLYSMKMDYVFCYYRPDNKFPSHVFGGAARNIKDPKICSLDQFAYFHQRVDRQKQAQLPAKWLLEPALRHDLDQVQLFYENESGGLMMECLHLSPDLIDLAGLSAEFRRIGLKRERHLYALRYKEKLQALLVVNSADLGLNMSDLTNSIQFIVLKPDHLSADLIKTAVAMLSGFFEYPDIPVLFYPQQAAETLVLEFEKSYTLWIYNTNNLDYYFKYLKRLIKFIHQ